MSTIPFSVGRLNDAGQIDRAVALISAAVKRLSPGTGVADVVQTAAGEVKLTHFTHGLGCACKLRPQNLEKVLAALPRISHPNVLIGNDQADDAAVYQLDEKTALVQTVDFFTPVVDNPYDFGAIAAANSLSDIYAMGATPLFALNIVGFPEKRLPLSVLQDILLGANDKAAEAGIPIVGGHTVEDSEPKFGLAVTGKVHPGEFWSNGGALVGDRLILTKPLGLGILTTSLKRGLLEPETARLVVATMAELNRVAAEQARQFTVHACTDVTGFGLMGHLKEMTVASEVTARIELAQVPILPEARNLALSGVIPGGSLANQDYVAPFTNFAATIADVDRLLLCDAQTSGGLLFSIPAAEVAEFLAALSEKNIMAAEIGRILEKGKGQIQIV
ncbi:selenide, water dikinase SelD [bacterium]|nr:selenide, water dikinase SelD [bacterium]